MVYVFVGPIGWFIRPGLYVQIGFAAIRIMIHEHYSDVHFVWGGKWRRGPRAGTIVHQIEFYGMMTTKTLDTLDTINHIATGRPFLGAH